MGDKVQYTLERLTPQLLDLEKIGLFSRNEVRRIQLRRQEHEYSLISPNSREKDFLEAINYEKAMEKKRIRRKKALSLTKRTKLDFHFTRRIISLYSRMIHKFDGNIILIKEYLGYLVKTRSLKKFNMVIGHILQLHPTIEELWKLGAYVEADLTGDAINGRNLLQQGIRMNEGSILMWEIFFKYELDFIQKLYLRHAALTTIQDKPEDEKIQIIDDENILHSDSEMKEEQFKPNYSICQIILDNAQKTFTDPIALIQLLHSFLSHTYNFPDLSEINILKKEIKKLIIEKSKIYEIPNLFTGYKKLLERNLYCEGLGVVDGYLKTQNKYSKYINKILAEEIKVQNDQILISLGVRYVDLYVESKEQTSQTHNLDDILHISEQIFERCNTEGIILLYIKILPLLCNLPKYEQKYEELLKRAYKAYDENIDLACMYAKYELTKGKNEGRSDKINIRNSLKVLNEHNGDKKNICNKLTLLETRCFIYMQGYSNSENKVKLQIHKLVSNNLANDEITNRLLSLYLDWIKENLRDNSELNEYFGYIMKLNKRITKEILNSILESYILPNEIDNLIIRKIYEYMLKFYENEFEIWKDFLSFEKEQNLLNAPNIYLRYQYIKYL